MRELGMRYTCSLAIDHYCNCVYYCSRLHFASLARRKDQGGRRGGGQRGKEGKAKRPRSFRCCLLRVNKCGEHRHGKGEKRKESSSFQPPRTASEWVKLLSVVHWTLGYLSLSVQCIHWASLANCPADTYDGDSSTRLNHSLSPTVTLDTSFISKWMMYTSIHSPRKLHSHCVFVSLCPCVLVSLARCVWCAKVSPLPLQMNVRVCFGGEEGNKIHFPHITKLSHASHSFSER